MATDDAAKAKKFSSKDVMVAIMTVELRLNKMKERTFNKLAMIKEALLTRGKSGMPVVQFHKYYVSLLIRVKELEEMMDTFEKGGSLKVMDKKWR